MSCCSFLFTVPVPALGDGLLKCFLCGVLSGFGSSFDVTWLVRVLGVWVWCSWSIGVCGHVLLAIFLVFGVAIRFEGFVV